MTVLNGTQLSKITNDDKKIIVFGSESKGIREESFGTSKQENYNT